MPRLFTTAGVLLLMCAFVPVQAQDRQVGGVGLTMFADMNFRGEVVTLRNDNPNLNTVGLYRLASSLEVGPGEMWEICDDSNYGGACLVVSGSESDLRRRGWNDRIASARRVRNEGRRGRGNGPPIVTPPVVQGGLELYSGARFYGTREHFTSAVSNLDGTFNDRAMSLRVAPNETWEVCEHANFRNCRVVSSFVMDLGEIGLARSISSVRPVRTNGRGNAGPRLVLFDERGFGGATRTIERDTPVLLGFSNRAESVQVTGGSWEICDRPKFSGRCITITGNLQDLGPVGFANQIQSVRLR